jgi:hypothetical protein
MIKGKNLTIALDSVSLNWYLLNVSSFSFCHYSIWITCSTFSTLSQSYTHFPLWWVFSHKYRGKKTQPEMKIAFCLLQDDEVFWRKSYQVSDNAMVCSLNLFFDTLLIYSPYQLLLLFLQKANSASLNSFSTAPTHILLNFKDSTSYNYIHLKNIYI